MAFFPAAGLHRCSPRLLPRPHLCRSPPQSTSPSTALSSTPALPSSPSPVSPRCHLLYDRRPPSSPQAAAHDRSAIDFAVPLPPVPLVFPGRARDHRDDAHLLRRDPATQTSVCAIACDPQSAASADRLSSATLCVPVAACAGLEPIRAGFSPSDTSPRPQLTPASARARAGPTDSVPCRLSRAGLRFFHRLLRPVAIHPPLRRSDLPDPARAGLRFIRAGFPLRPWPPTDQAVVFPAEPPLSALFPRRRR